MNKRGKLTLVMLIELIVAIFACSMFIKAGTAWAKTDAYNKIYFARDLALITDSLYASPHNIVTTYEGNLSKFVISSGNPFKD